MSAAPMDGLRAAGESQLAADAQASGAGAAPLAQGDDAARFDALARVLDASLAAGERHAAMFDGEDTDFVRMNHGKVRQPGSVRQRYLAIRLIRGQRHATHRLSLCGDAGLDAASVRDAVATLRGVIGNAHDDPHLALPDVVASSESRRMGELPEAPVAVDAILDAAHGSDLVGLYASGSVMRGFANSEGQRNWHEARTFNLQWSLYHRADKAVKSAYAGFDWNPATLADKMDEARERLALVARPSRSLAPGRYRAYLAPSAVDEIVSLLGWGGFSGRALATRQSPLARLAGGERLDPRVSMREDIADGVAPSFQSDGFVRPGSVSLIERGALADSLVSPRTSREFAMAGNGANAWESPEALAMDGGELDAADALAALGDGLAIGNLHYLNYSDRPSCRLTGMTRFATFVVEGGRIVAPIDVLRFDDTLFRLFGANLEALTRERELALSSESYGGRSLMSTHVPGALVRDMAFTL